MRSRWWPLLAVCVACGGDVMDGRGDDGGDDQPPAGDPSAALFDEAVIRTYEVEVAPADWAELEATATEEAYVPARVTLEGETVEDAAIRYKGGYGTLLSCFDGAGNRVCDKLSMKISFNEVDPDGELHGVRKLNFHAMDGDGSKMHDAIGYRLFRDHGVPAPRTAFARLVVNGESLGLFVVVENVDGRFTRARFPDGGEGNLYKDVWPTSTDPAYYRNGLKTNEDEGASVDRMVRFAEALRAAGDDGFEAVLAAWTDLDQLIEYFAVARLIDHWDDVIAWYCFESVNGPTCINHNYFWYESVDEDRVWFIPWDLDNTLQEPSPRAQAGLPDWDELDAGCEWIPLWGVHGRAPSCDPILRRVVTQLWDRYAARSRALIDGAFAEAAIGARVDALEALLADEVAADPVLDVQEWRDAVAWLRRSIDAKRAYAESRLAR